MNSSLPILAVIVLFLLSTTTQFGFSVSSESPMDNFITWDDLNVKKNWDRLNLNDRFNSSRVIVVSKDGTGDSLTVQGAVDLVPLHNTLRVKILILPGIYRFPLCDDFEHLHPCREKVIVPASKPYVSFIGTEANRTVISWNTKASDKDNNGQEIGTYNTATVSIESDYFCATKITFENTEVAVPGGVGMQAVALRLSGDKSFLYKTRMLGSQDTLLDDTGTHYFYKCYIQGSIDFIFGNARSLYEECTLYSTARGPGAIAASHRESAMENTGFSFVQCKVKGSGNIYLGRAWGRYARTLYYHCDMEGIITPIGWHDWGDPSRRWTVSFGEYQCRGKGANLGRRAPWSKSFTYEEAKPFLDKTYIEGDQWFRL
ncbi:PREDICTED: pectinesterase QRT1 [Nelumbo nucifera]|uniref:Pectinesterase n=1 Tax=Nelumbo nucifera TaxID=4432 RepID=A0A1U8Q7T3_NELNU|nr:PREDICTED: pectinesterase QRT1 [Nelumbo nucifera]